MSLVLTENRHGGAVRVIRLNRPAKYNALGPEIIAQLVLVIRQAIDDAEVRVLHLCGAGKSFCSGGDMKWMALLDKDNAHVPPDVLYDLLALIANAPKAITATVHGRMFGGGVGLVAACDLVVADDASTFCLPELKHGLVPAMIYPLLARRLSQHAIRALTLTSRVMTAPEALTVSLVDAVEQSNQAKDAIINTWHTALIGAAPNATTMAKQLFSAHPVLGEGNTRQFVLGEIDRARRSAEAQTRIGAFFDKTC